MHKLQEMKLFIKPYFCTFILNTFLFLIFILNNFHEYFIQFFVFDFDCCVTIGIVQTLSMKIIFKMTF